MGPRLRPGWVAPFHCRPHLPTSPLQATIILIGDGTHGTSEHYKFRADLTLTLAGGDTGPGIDAVLLEADVPAAAWMNAFVRLHPPYDRPDAHPATALEAARTRFPTWMWSNEEMSGFLTDLRALNARRDPATRVGVYGLDIYALFESAAAVVRHFEDAGEVAAARAARRALACLTTAGGDRSRDGVSYAYGLACGAKQCAQETVASLVAAARRRGAGAPPAGPPGSPAEEAGLECILHALAVVSGESYYSKMVFGGFGGDDSTWDIRDAAFADAVGVVTKAATARRGTTLAPPPRVVVWAHNSHCGNAKATSMYTLRREYNIGSLLRDAHGDAVFAIGCLTYTGTVAAASSWGGRVRQRALRPAMAGSYEALLHAVSVASGRPSFAVDLRSPTPAARALAIPRLQRAVGVQYRPRTERASHMFTAALGDQFACAVFWDETRAVTPLPASPQWGDVLGYNEASGEDSD